MQVSQLTEVINKQVRYLHIMKQAIDDTVYYHFYFMKNASSLS